MEKIIIDKMCRNKREKNEVKDICRVYMEWIDKNCIGRVNKILSSIIITRIIIEELIPKRYVKEGEYFYSQAYRAGIRHEVATILRKLRDEPACRVGTTNEGEYSNMLVPVTEEDWRLLTDSSLAKLRRRIIKNDHRRNKLRTVAGLLPESESAFDLLNPAKDEKENDEKEEL